MTERKRAESGYYTGPMAAMEDEVRKGGRKHMKRHKKQARKMRKGARY